MTQYFIQLWNLLLGAGFDEPESWNGWLEEALNYFRSYLASIFNPNYVQSDFSALPHNWEVGDYLVIILGVVSSILFSIGIIKLILKIFQLRVR